MGGRLPPIQKIQKARAAALATRVLDATTRPPAARRGGKPCPPDVLFFWFFLLAIPLSFARQERRTDALLAGPSGLPYFFPNRRMDTTRNFSDQRKRYRRHEPYSLSPAFDVAVIVALLIALVGSIIG